jgi:shikimate dehydrogenase
VASIGSGHRAAVLGSPIGHSLSPVLHRAAYEALGLTDWSYDRIECQEDGLAAFVAGLDTRWAGLSLTMPLKRVALDVATTRSSQVEAVGAANTLVSTPTGWRAENTDIRGIEAALRDIGVSTVGSALVLGAGGTAQACLAALAALGCGNPTVLVRDVTRTGDLQAAAARLDLEVQVRGGLHDGPLPAADVVISTLPRGAADRLVCDPATGAVLDVVYDPWPTPFAAAAATAGIPVQSGLAMLLHQAAAQVTLMTGQDAPVEPMRTALEAAAARRNPASGPR